MGQNQSAGDIDSRLEAVGHAVRRGMLYELLRTRREGGDTVSIASLVEGGNAREVALRHRHLPKLADLGYVTVGPADERVEPGPQFDDIVPLLDHLAASDDAEPAETGAVGRSD